MVPGSIPGGVTGFFSDALHSEGTMALESIQPLVQMSTRNIPGGKGGRCVRLTTYHHTVPFSRILGALTSQNRLGLFRPVTGQIYFFPSYCKSKKILTVFMLERCSTQQSACWYRLLTADQGTGSDLSIRFAVMPGYCLLKNIKSIRELVMVKNKNWNSKSFRYETKLPVTEWTKLWYYILCNKIFFFVMSLAFWIDYFTRILQMVHELPYWKYKFYAILSHINPKQS